METVADHGAAIRPLARENLEAVVAIDAAIEGRPRRDYFERRLKAALLEPKLHAQFAAADDAGLAGYILARVLEGEFGRTEPGLRLEVVGVRDDVRGHGVGRQLFDALTAWARRHGIRDLRTQAAWNDHRMVRWLDAMGFTLAPNHVVDCAVARRRVPPERDDPVALPEGEGPAQRDRLRRPPGQRLRAPRPRQRRRARDDGGRPRRASCASTAASPAATAATYIDAQAERDDGRLGDPRVAVGAAGRRRSSAS